MLEAMRRLRKEVCNLFRSRGFTIIELMVTIAVLAILITVAIPGFESMIEKRRLIGATESIYSDLQFARSEAVKRSRDVVVTVVASGSTGCTGWNLRVTETSAPTVNLANTCGDGFPNIALSANFSTKTFDGIRGTVGAGGTITITSPKGLETHVVLSRFGRVRSCSPTGVKHIGGYPSC